MQLLFKQRIFSWFGSYDIFDETGRVVYKVEGQLSFGRMFRIYDAQGKELGYIKQEMLAFLPCYNIYVGDKYLGRISRRLSLFTPRYDIDYKNWNVEGNWVEWDYSIRNSSGNEIASVSKQLFNFTDTYVINVTYPEDALCALMLVLAIDAEKASRN